MLMRRALEAATDSLELAAAVQSERQQFAMLRSLRNRLDSYLALADQAGLSEESIYRQNEALLGAIADQARYIGPIGSGTIAKLVHNCAGYAISTALAEVVTLGVKAGLEPLQLWRAIRQGAVGRRRSFDTLAGNFLTGQFEPPNFMLKLAHKDVSLATQVGKEHGVPMRLANLTLEEMTEALARGWEGRDSRSSMILQKERSGLTIKCDPADIAAILRDKSNA